MMPQPGVNSFLPYPTGGNSNYPPYPTNNFPSFPMNTTSGYPGSTGPGYPPANNYVSVFFYKIINFFILNYVCVL